MYCALGPSLKQDGTRQYTSLAVICQSHQQEYNHNHNHKMRKDEIVENFTEVDAM